MLTQRKSFKIRVYGIQAEADITLLNIGIENCSRLSIAVTQITLLCKNSRTPCTANPTLLCESVRRKGREEISRKQTYSTQMPITVAGLSAQNAFILFEDLPELPASDATTLTVEVATNRGRPIQMKLELPDGWAAQRKIL